MPEHLQFDHYRVLTDAQGKPIILGRGGMGVTLKATDTVLGRDVALKVIRASQLDNEDAQLRFLREAAATARLHHRNIATIYHQGRTEENVYYAMEFIEGMTVESLVKQQGPLPLTDALDITRQVVQALSEAEKHGLVHRDIKPANIMLKVEADGQRVVKLIDFGLAKFVRERREETQLTQAGGYLGTAITSSPEQCRGEELDTRSDIYSLGITLWYMLEGTTPFADENPLHVLLGHLQKPPPFERLAHRPDAVRRLLQQMLEKRPEDRPANTAVLRRLLDDCMAATQAPPPPDDPPTLAPGLSIPHVDTPTMGTALTPPDGIPTPAPRTRRLATPLALLVAAIVAIGLLYTWRRAPDGPASAAKNTDAPAPPPPAEAPAQPPTVTALATAAQSSLNQLDWATFFEAYQRLHDQFGATDDGAAACAELERQFGHARLTQRAVLAAWATQQPETLEAAAERGLTEARLALGDSFARSDPTRAASAYALAAQQYGERHLVHRELEALVSQRALAGLPPPPAAAQRLQDILTGFRKGRYAAADLQAAEPTIERLAQLGELEAMLLLGERWTASQPEAASNWYRQAALRYDREQQWRPALETYLLLIEQFPATPAAPFARRRVAGIGDQLLSGDITLTPAALSELDPVLRRAGALPTPSVLEFLGTQRLAPAPAEALQLFTTAAEAGSPSAMAQTGLMLQRGIGTTADPAAAQAWFRRAAEAQNTMGCYLLALCLLENNGSETEAAEAVALLEIAAAQRYAPAMDQLADCYRRGVGVTRDFTRARELYDAAIGLHHLDSLGNLGVMFMNGEGGPRNETQAVRLFAEGAEQGNAWCAYLYGAALWHGTGIPQDHAQASLHLQRAAAAGIAQARTFLAQQPTPPANGN